MSVNQFSSIEPRLSTRLNHEEVSYAGVILFTDTGKIVCIQQKRGIDIVGGHRDPGESALETLIRETYEELGFQIVPHIHAPMITAIREGNQEYRGVARPKMVYYSVNAGSEQSLLEAFKQRTHDDEASEMVFLTPEEFIGRYSSERGNNPFVENMRIAVQSAVDHKASEKGLTIGLSGLGDHQIRGHLLPLETENRVTDIIGFDPDTRGALEHLKKNGIEFSQNPGKLDSISSNFGDSLDSQVDAVFISSPDRFHLPQMTEALHSGKHVFCEKPLIHTVDEVNALVENILYARHHGLVLSSCHPRRFDRPFVWLKEFLMSKENPLGKIKHVGFTFSYPKPQEGKESLHSGLLADHFNHEIDLVNFYLGWDDFFVRKLSDSQTKYVAHGIRADDVTFYFSGKRDRERTASYAESITIRGDSGSITVDTETGEATLFRDGESIIVETGLQTDYVGRFQLTTSNFISAIVAGERSYLTPRDLLINSLSGAVLTEDGAFDSVDYQKMLTTIG